MRSASPASLYWDSPPLGSTGGAPSPTRSRRTAGRTKSRGHNYNNSDHGDDDDDDDGGDFVDLFTIETLMPGKGAGPRGIPPLAQEMEMEAVISDSGSAFDDGMMVVNPADGLRRRRGEIGRGRAEAGQSGRTR